MEGCPHKTCHVTTHRLADRPRKRASQSAQPHRIRRVSARLPHLGRQRLSETVTQHRLDDHAAGPRHVPEEGSVATDDVRRLQVGEDAEPIGNDVVGELLHRTRIDDAQVVGPAGGGVPVVLVESVGHPR